MDKNIVKQYLIEGTVWALVEKVITALMMLFLSVILARLLTLEEMGGYFLALNLTTFFAIVARMGLDNTMIRYVSNAMGRNDPGGARNIFLKGFCVVVVWTVFTAILFYFILGPWLANNFFDSPILESVTNFIAVWLVLLSFQFFLSESFRGYQNIFAASVFGGALTATLAFSLLSFISQVFVITDLSRVLAIIISATAFNVMFAGWSMYRQLRLVNSALRFEVSMSEIAGHSWPLLINAVTLFVIAHSDLWILGALGSDTDVAIYGAAARMVILCGLALSIVNKVVPPLIGQYDPKSDKKELENILRKTASIAIIPAFFVLAIFVIFGGQILSFVFGDSYRGGISILAILSLAQAVNVFVGSCGYALIMSGYRKTIMVISIFSASIGILSGMILVNPYGAIGVAVGMASGMIIQQLSMLGFVRLKCGYWTHADIRFINRKIRNILTRRLVA